MGGQRTLGPLWRLRGQQILLTADLQTISQQMKEELKLRKVEVTKSWCDIAQRVSDNIK